MAVTSTIVSYEYAVKYSSGGLERYTLKSELEHFYQNIPYAKKVTVEQVI